MKKRLFFSWMVLAALLLLSAVVTGAWFISRPPKTVSEPEVTTTTPRLPEQHSVIDAHTAEPLPAISPEMAVAIRQLSNHSTDGLQETVNPDDGSITLDHKDRLQSVMVGVVGPDGKIIIRHGEDFLQNVKPE